MGSSVFTKEYEIFRKLLTQYRNEASVTQFALAKKLGKPQSYVSKYESGERRLDVIEFLKIAEALPFDPIKFINDLEKEINK